MHAISGSARAPGGHHHTTQDKSSHAIKHCVPGWVRLEFLSWVHVTTHCLRIPARQQAEPQYRLRLLPAKLPTIPHLQGIDLDLGPGLVLQSYCNNSMAFSWPRSSTLLRLIFGKLLYNQASKIPGVFFTAPELLGISIVQFGLRWSKYYFVGRRARHGREGRCGGDIFRGALRYFTFREKIFFWEEGDGFTGCFSMTRRFDAELVMPSSVPGSKNAFHACTARLRCQGRYLGVHAADPPP